MTTPATARASCQADLDRLADVRRARSPSDRAARRASSTRSARRLNRLMRGALERFVDGEAFAKMKPGEARRPGLSRGPAGRGAAGREARRRGRPRPRRARRGGDRQGARAASACSRSCRANRAGRATSRWAPVLRAYDFTDHKTARTTTSAERRPGFTFMATKPEEPRPRRPASPALAEGVFFTRDLVNEPVERADHDDFADRLVALREPRAEGRGAGRGRARSARACARFWPWGRAPTARPRSW